LHEEEGDPVKYDALSPPFAPSFFCRFLISVWSFQPALSLSDKLLNLGSRSEVALLRRSSALSSVVVFGCTAAERGGRGGARSSALSSVVFGLSGLLASSLSGLEPGDKRLHQLLKALHRLSSALSSVAVVFGCTAGGGRGGARSLVEPAEKRFLEPAEKRW